MPFVKEALDVMVEDKIVYGLDNLSRHRHRLDQLVASVGEGLAL